MLTVDDYEIIRRKYRDEGLSQREIADLFRNCFVFIISFRIKSPLQ